ncbi:MAG: crossover junction endodeoxyribonuclease RuvC [Bryobacterales bacterium]|nr:crossover junction endodeoxyribonuclease RuvC [Bryobacterales bacterium]
MRILGVDCGTERTGYGVVDSDGKQHRMIDCGVIRTSPRDPLEKRLLVIARRLRDVIGNFEPQAVAVEEVFYAANVKTALKLSHVRGVALLAAAEAGLPVGEYSPLEIKTSVVGYGRAQKQQVQLMVQSLLKLEQVVESEDASDALAAAICHGVHALHPILGASR